MRLGDPFRRLFHELHRRRVFRVAAFYAVLAYGALEAIDLFVSALGFPDWIVTTAAVVAIAGFPVALVLAWFFDLTPLGLLRTPDVARAGAGDGPIEPVRTVPLGTRRLVAGGVGIGIVLTIVGIGAYGWASTLRQDVAAPGEVHALAVLPFADRSPRGDQAYLSDGITEELLNALARAGDLRVASRSSSFRYRGEEIDVRSLGQTLGVDAVLEGSVQREGDRLRVTVQLTDTRTGYSIWADAYNGDARDLFSMQERIARQVLASLGVGAASQTIVDQGTSDLQAYDHFLRGNHYLASRTRDEVLRAIEEYRRAAEIDPGFAAAHARQGLAHAIVVDWGWRVPGLSREELLARGTAHAEQAVRLDPRSAEAWLASAYLRVVRDPYRMEGAVEAFEHARRLDPRNPEIHYQHGQALMVLGRYDEAMAAYHRAIAIEPDRWTALVPMSAIASIRGDAAQAKRWNDSAIAVAPANSYARVHDAVLALVAGRPADALEAARLAHTLDRGHPVPVLSVLAAALAASGAHVDAQSRYEEARAAAGPDPVSNNDAVFLATAALAVGDTANALRVLERTEPRGAWLWFYLESPHNDPLRGHPRFRAVSQAADPRG